MGVISTTMTVHILVYLGQEQGVLTVESPI